MKTLPLLLSVALLAGCVASQVNISFAERQKKYLAELPQEREHQWGPCECTYHFLADTGAAGVPVVIQALDNLSGPTNILMRALIVDGASYYSNGTNTLVAPIMDRATRDPAADVQAVAKRWLEKQHKK
ncbi:MAG: hypothetical protein NTY53_01090 [Kiritimatiellaeota bacterium]|nr:hypothetical protein [Kiritimatiellota bacterium]